MFTTDPSGATAGSAFTGQPVVKTEDTYGNLSTVGLGASRTVTIAIKTGTGSLQGTPTYDIGTSAGNGTITGSGLRIDQAGSFTLSATVVSGLAEGDSGSFTVSPAAASKLVFTTSPVTVSAGVASGTITVQRQDPYNNPNTADASRSVTLSSDSSGTVTFTPASPLTISIGASSANFTYTDTKAGNPTITADSTSPSTITSATQQETVNPGTANAAHSTLTPASVSIATGGSTTVLTVQARDVNDNILTGGGSTVVFSRSSGTGTVGSTTDNSDGTYTATVTSPVGAGSGTFAATLDGIAVGAPDSSVVTYTSGLPPASITGVVNQTNTFGMTTVTLTGTVGAGTTHPANGETTISATINGYATVHGEFTNADGAFVIYYADASLATAGVGDYTITYAYTGGANLSAAADNTDTKLTVLPALTGTSDAGALDGYAAATIPVIFVAKNGGVITYSNEVQAATLTLDHTAFTITIGVPPGTTTVSLKPRFYLRKLFTFSPPSTGANTGALDISGAFFVGGDADGNNEVDGTDYAWLRYWWGKNLAGWTAAVGTDVTDYDMNSDGMLDANDLPGLERRRGDQRRGLRNPQEWLVSSGGGSIGGNYDANYDELKQRKQTEYEVTPYDNQPGPGTCVTRVRGH